MDLNKVLKAAKAQNAELIQLWVPGWGGLIWIGEWQVHARTLVNVASGLPFAEFRKALDRENHYTHAWDMMMFRVKSHRNHPDRPYMTATNRPEVLGVAKPGLAYCTPAGIR